MKNLLSLYDQPTQYWDCCCTLSKLLVMNLARMKPHGPLMTVSIGRGTGLAEAILLEFSIEFSDEIIRYLSEQTVEIEKGT